MTPFEIGILLHYATTPGDHPLMSDPPPIWRETINRFIADGLLARDESGAAAYAATDKLRAYTDALQRVPLPVQVWVTPNDRIQPPAVAGRLE